MSVPDSIVPEKGKERAQRHFMDTANPRIFTMRTAQSMPIQDTDGIALKERWVIAFSTAALVLHF